jgi:hypothetical protein
MESTPYPRERAGCDRAPLPRGEPHRDSRMGQFALARVYIVDLRYDRCPHGKS